MCVSECQNSYTGMVDTSAALACIACTSQLTATFLNMYMYMVYMFNEVIGRNG